MTLERGLSLLVQGEKCTVDAPNSAPRQRTTEPAKGRWQMKLTPDLVACDLDSAGRSDEDPIASCLGLVAPPIPA